MSSRVGQLPSLGGGSSSVMRQAPLAPISASRNLVGNPLQSRNTQPGLQARKEQGSRFTSISGSPAFKDGRQSMFSRSKVPPPLAPVKGRGRPQQGGHMTPNRQQPPIGISFQSSVLHVHRDSNDDDSEVIMIGGPMQPRPMLHPLSTEDSSRATPSRGVQGLRGLREMRNSSPNLPSPPNSGRGASLMPVKSEVKPEKGKKKKNKSKKKAKKDGTLVMANAQMPVGQLQPLRPIQNAGSHAALTPIKSPAMAADIEFFKSIGSRKTTDQPGSPRSSTSVSIDGRRSLTPASPFQQPNLQPIGSPLSTSSLQVSSVDLQMLASPREPLSPNNRASTLQAPVNSTGSSRNFHQRPPVPIEDIEIFTGPREKLTPVKAAAFMQTPLKAIGVSQGQEHEIENLPSPRRGTLAPIAQNKPPTLMGINSALGPISHRAQASTLSEESPIGQVKVNPVGDSRNIINAQSKSLEEKRPFGTGTQGGLGQGSLKRGPATNPIQSAQEVTSKSYQPPFKVGRRRQTSDFYDSTPEDTDEEDAIHDEMYALAGSSPRQTSPHWESPTKYDTTRADITQGNKSRTVPVNTQLAIVKRCSTTGSEGGTKVEFFRVLDEEVPGGDLCDDNTAVLTPSSSRNTAKSKQKQHHPVDSSDESSKSFVFESPSTHHSYHTSDEDTDVYDSPTQEESEPEEIKGETYLDKLRKKLLKDSEDQDDTPQNTDLGRNAQSLKQAQQVDTSLEQPTKRDMYNAMVAAIAREIDEADNKNLNEQTKLAKEVDPIYTSGGSKDSFSKELTSEESTDTENMRSDAVNGAIPLQHNAKTSFTANNMSSTSNNKPETQNIGNLEKKDIAAKVMQTKPSMAEATNLKASTTSSGTQCFPTMLSRPMPQQKYTPAQQKIATGTKEPGFSPVSLQQSSANTKVPTANESNTEETLTKVQEAEITIGTSSTGSKCFPTMLSRATPLQKNTPAPQRPEIVRNGQTASISQDSSANVNAPSSKKVENSTKTDNAATSKDQLGTSSGSNCFPTMISRATPLQRNTPARQQIENGAKGLTPISISQSSGTGLPAKQPNTDGTVTKEGTATGSTVVASTAREPVNKGPFADGCYPNGGNAKQPSTTRSENNTIVSTANRPTTNGNIENGNTIDRPAIKGSAAKSTLTTEVSLTPITNGPSVTGQVTTVKGPITKGPTAKLPIKKESMANGSMTNESTAQGSITVGPATKGTVAKGQTTKGPTAKPANSKGMTLKDTVTSTAQEARNAPTKKQTISVTGELDSPSKTREDIKNRGNKQVNSNEKPAELHEDTSRRSQSLSNNTEAQISHTKEVEATKDNVESLKQRTTEQECNQTDGTDSEISIQETEDAETSVITSMIDEKTQSGECNTSIQSGDGNGNVTQHIRTSTSEKSHMSYTRCNSHTSSHHRSSHSGRTGHSHRRRSKESLTTNCRSIYSEGTRSSHCEDTCCNRSQHYCCRSRSGSSQLSRSGKSFYHSQRSRRSQNDCCRKHYDTNDWHRNTSGSALSDESQESSPRDSCTCIHCNQKRLSSRDCRSISGCNYSGASNKGWDDYESNRSATYMSRSQQEKRDGECEMLPPEVKQTVGKHRRHTAKQAPNRNCSDLDVNVSSCQQTISNGSDMTSAFSSDAATSKEVQKRGSMTSKRIAANSGNSTDVSASSVKSETCPISPISFKSDMSSHRIRKNKRDVKNSHRSSNERRKHTHRNLPERNYNQAVNDLRDRVPIKISHNSTEADTKQVVKSRKSKALGQLTPDFLYTATEEVPRDMQYITKQKSIESWLRESTQSVSFTKESASSIEPCPVSSQEGVTISNDSLSLMNVSDEQLHQTEECEHQTRECESSCKQDETDIRDGAYSSNDANILKSSKDIKMALKLVKLGLIETTSDFEEYKHKVLMDEVQRREFSLKDAPSAKTEMISPQVIICPCSASHFQPQTRLPPHRCSRCYLMCSEPVTYGDKIEIPADKAKSSYTTNFDVPSRKVTEQVEEPIFRTKMFGLTGIPSEDKKVWQKFCRHILSGFSEDNKIGKLPGLTTPAFQSNMSSTSAAFMKPTVSTMVQNDTNHSLLHKAKPTNTEETLSTMTDSLSAINSEDVCAGHIQEIQAQNKKIQKLETQLEELRREMKLEQVQKESELVRIRSQRQYDREVFHRKLRQAKENAEVTHNSYQFAVDEEQEDLDIISLSVSDNETFNMGLKSKSLRETVTQVSDPNQIERDTLYSSTKTFRRGFQVAQTDGRAKDSKNNEWNLKNEEISTFKSNGDKLQEMLEQHKQRLQDANTSKLSREDKFKGALIGQSESYAKISHLVIDDQSLQNDHLNETSTVEALTASLDILKRDNTELKSESEVKDKEIWELKKERLDLKDRVFQLDRELFDTQDKLIKKSAVITDLEKTKQFLDNKVIQLAEQQREHNMIMSRKNQLLIEGKRSGNDLREKIERLEDHLRFRCRINNNLRDDKVLLEKKLALLECQYDCAWNERDGSYNMMKRKLNTSSSERI